VNGPTFTGLTGLAASGYASCIVASGVAYCWGSNEFGQLGDGTTIDRDAPVAVALANVAQIRVGHDFACALDTSGALYCWGDNSWGQIGIGTRSRSLVPTEVRFP
jgi:serine/threonine-protein kinase